MRNHRLLRAYTRVSPSIEHQPVALPKISNGSSKQTTPTSPDTTLPCDDLNPPVQSQGRSLPKTDVHEEVTDSVPALPMEDPESTGGSTMVHEQPSSPQRVGEQPTVVPETTTSGNGSKPSQLPACARGKCRPPMYFEPEMRKCETS